MEKAWSFIHQPDQVARKASDVSAADWRYQIHMKKYHYDIFHVFCYGISRSSFYNTEVYMIN